MNFTLKYSENNDFLGYVFESQKRCFPQFSMFSVLYLISVIFSVFFRGKLATLV